MSSCGHCLTVAKHDSPHNPLPHSPPPAPSASISPVAAAGLRSRSSSSEVVPSVWTALEQLQSRGARLLEPTYRAALLVRAPERLQTVLSKVRRASAASL